jgi:hypothetical protein
MATDRIRSLGTLVDRILHHLIRHRDQLHRRWLRAPPGCSPLTRLFQTLTRVVRNNHDRSNNQDDLSRDVSIATELQCFLHPLKWNNCLDEGSKVAIVYEFSDF